MINMKSLMTFFVTSLLAAHAAMGCCLHHEHEHKPLQAADGCHHDDHHADHHSSGHEDEDSSHRCDDETCVYVLQKTVSHDTHDWTFAPFFLTANITPDVSLAARMGRLPYNDAPFSSGTARHVWQCVWVI